MLRVVSICTRGTGSSLLRSETRVLLDAASTLISLPQDTRVSKEDPGLTAVTVQASKGGDG